MRISLGMGRTPGIVLILSLLVFSSLFGYLAVQVQPSILLMAVMALAVFVVSFLNIELGLYILIFSMLLSPEFIVGDMSERGTGGRGLTLRLEDFLLVVIGFAWFARTAVIKEMGLFRKTPLNRPIFLYVMACIVSTFLGVLAGTTGFKSGFFFMLKYFEYFIVYFMVVNNIRDKAQVRRFMACIFLTCLIISAYGMLQIPLGERVTAPFEGKSGEPNTLGGYLLLMACMAAGMLSKAKNPREVFFYLLVLASLTLPFLFTESRSSYLGFIAAALVFAMTKRRKSVVIGLLIAAFLSSPLWLPQRAQDRVMHTVSQAEHPDQVTIGGVRLDTSTSARLMDFDRAFQAFLKKPVFGYGVTGFYLLDSQLVRVLLETGIVGLLIFLYLLYTLFKATLSNMRGLKDPYFQGISLGFLVGFAGLLVHSAGANTFIIVRIMEPFWFLAGIVIMLPELERREEDSDLSLSERGQGKARDMRAENLG